MTNLSKSCGLEGEDYGTSYSFPVIYTASSSIMLSITISIVYGYIVM